MPPLISGVTLKVGAAAVQAAFLGVSSVYGGGGVAAPQAVIMTDAETLPSAYTGGYFPASTDLKTYRGYAPHPVYFSGWTSTPFDFIASFDWDFGAGSESDYGGRYFNGINAAHVFETPGSYTVTLTVTDYFGRTSSATRQVVIYAGGTGYNSIASYGSSDAIGAFAGTSYALITYYVDPVNGSDSYDGKSQTVDGGSVGPWQTFVKAINALRTSGGVLKTGDKVLLKRGATFDVSGLISDFSHGAMRQGVHFGTYGSGAKPIVRWVGNANPNTNSFLFDIPGLGAGFVSFTDIVFNFRNPGVHTINGLWRSLSTCRNVLSLRCDFLDPHNTSITTGGNMGGYLTNEPYGTFLVGNTATQVNNNDTSVVLFFYGYASGLCLVGNTCDVAGNHINYITNPHGAVIADNVFSRPAFGRTALRVTGGPLASPAEKVYISRNKLLGWIDPLTSGTAHNGGGTRYNYRICNLSPNGLPNEYSQDVVFERNIVTNFEGGLSIVNQKNAVVRNNIFVTPSTSATDVMVLGEVGGTNQMRPLDNVKIYNNTLVFNGAYIGSKFPFVLVNGTSSTGPYHTGVSVSNNIAISVSGRQDWFVKFGENLAGQFAAMTMNNNLLDSGYANYANIVGTEYTLTNWRTESGLDTASIKDVAGVITAPTVVSHSAGSPASLAAGLSEATAYEGMLRLGSSLAADAGAAINVYRDYAGSSRSGAVDIGAFEVAPFAPVNTAIQVISGQAYVGMLLSASSGSWAAAPSVSGYVYQWYRSGASIGGATSSTYTLQAGDIGSTITVRVTATNTQGSTVAESVATSTITEVPAASGESTIFGVSAFGASTFGA